MSILNSVYDFIDAAVTAAAPNAFISGSIVHSDTFEEVLKGEQWIRIDYRLKSRPQVIGNVMKHTDARFFIQIVVRPDAQTGIGRREARRKANGILLELCTLFNNNRNLGVTDDSICDCLIEEIVDEPRIFGTVRHETSFIFLKINPE